MKQIFYIIIPILLLSCQNLKKESKSIDDNCDNTKLVNYVYPINNFTEENTLVYSLKSNRTSVIELFKHNYKLKINNDSLLFIVSKNAQGVTQDSTIFIVNKGIPKIRSTYTRVDFYPELLPAKETIIGNRYCEFVTFGDSFEYKIPTNEGEVVREFKGYTTHKEYVKKEFKGIEYNCAIFESKKTLTATFDGKTEKLKGTWKGCICENLGELYSTTTTEDGLLIEHKLEEIIRK